MEYPKIINESGAELVELTNAYDIWLLEELGGKETLTFNLYYDVEQNFEIEKWTGISSLVKSNALVKMVNRIFRINRLEFRQNDTGLRWLEVEAVARWYDLLKMPPKEAKEFSLTTITELLAYILPGSGWTAGYIEPVIDVQRGIIYNGDTNYMYFLREIERLYSAEVKIDTVLKTVGFVKRPGSEAWEGKYFRNKVNLKTMEITEDSLESIFRLYIYGKRGLSLTAIPGHNEYVDATTPPPYEPPPSVIFRVEEIDDPYKLQEAGLAVVEELSKPRKYFNCKVINLEDADPPQPLPVLGEWVKVEDTSIDFYEYMRVYGRKYYFDEPFNSIIELSTPQKDIRALFDKYQEFIKKGEDLGGTRISEEYGLVQFDEQDNIIADQWGLNTAQYKKYPNQIFNSSFEVYDTLFKPNFWDTSGVVTDDARFDSGHSLQLNAGQYAEQKEEGGVGLPDPAWWGWSPDTRYSFRCRGHGGEGKIRVQVLRDGVLQNIWTWRERDGSFAIRESGTQLDFDIQSDWHKSLITFSCSASGSGKIKLRIENIHLSRAVFIDAVLCEPDINGRWPSDYSHGPRSIASTSGLPSLSYAHVWAGNELNEALAQAPPPTIPTTYEFLHLYRDGLGRWRVRWRDIEQIIRDIAERPPGKLIEIFIHADYSLLRKPIEKNIGCTATILTHANESLTPPNKYDLPVSLSYSVSKFTTFQEVSKIATITSTIITSVS